MGAKREHERRSFDIEASVGGASIPVSAKEGWRSSSVTPACVHSSCVPSFQARKYCQPDSTRNTREGRAIGVMVGVMESETASYLVGNWPFLWWALRGLNPRLIPCEGITLPLS